MKLVSFESTGRWKAAASWGLLVAGLVGLPLAASATLGTWNSGDYGSYFSTPAPQIDATNFYNTGTWSINTLTPYPTLYTTRNTLNYTNKAGMTAQPGWEFDYGPLGLGGRGWSANFFNDNSGDITAVDAAIPDFDLNPSYQGHLIVAATNIVNKGLLTAQAYGEIVLSGGNVNLNHTRGLQILPISGHGSSGTPTNFVPDTAIYDEYWSSTNGNLTVNGPWWNGYALGTFSGTGIGMPCATTGDTLIGPFFLPLADSFETNLNPVFLTVTNASGHTSVVLLYSNIVHQAAFVYLGSNIPPALSGQIRFYPTGNPSNGFQIVAVQLAALFTNVVTAAVQSNSIYVVDAFASSTNHGLARNTTINPAASCGDPTYRPAAISVSRTEPVQYSNGTNYNAWPPDDFFYEVGWSNYIVRGGSCATYSASIDNVAAQVPVGGSVTNLPGRVRIYADTLNLNQAHIRAEGQILIQASNLTSTANALLDCQNLSYKLGSSTGLLNVTNLVRPYVDRLNGTIQLASCVWSNFYTVITPNWATNTTGTNGGFIEANLTNVIRVDLGLTMIDASGLITTVPVTVQDMVLRGTNIVVSDSMEVNNSFYLYGLSATLVGDIYFYGNLLNWQAANAPYLRYFTNNGFLSIPNYAHFGDDRPTNYLAFVNNGFIVAGGQTINSANLQLNSGSYTLAQYGSFVGIAQTAQLSGALLGAAYDIQFFANTIKLSNASILETYGTLRFNVTNSFSDGGVGAGNILMCENGFDLPLKPATGDLLGTTIDSYAPLSSDVEHYWAGEDRGASAAGFTNNVALGTLALIPEGTQAPFYLPQFSFYGATGGNGLYVYNLDLSQLVDYANEIYIDPSITIYYVTATLNAGVDTGSLTPEEYLDGQFGGRLRWIGVTSLPKSKPIPYGKLTANYQGAGTPFQLSFSAGSGQTNFVIEASTDLKHWKRLYTNDGPFGNYTDPDAGKYPYRFYRAVSPTNPPAP
jgi:hypothetical protein